LWAAATGSDSLLPRYAALGVTVCMLFNIWDGTDSMAMLLMLLQLCCVHHLCTLQSGQSLAHAEGLPPDHRRGPLSLATQSTVLVCLLYCPTGVVERCQPAPV
jgi:hypothetical protein